MDPIIPYTIIIEVDGGYFICKFKEWVKSEDGADVAVYKDKEYYHNLESALRDA